MAALVNLTELQILHRDDDLVAVDKPSGVLSDATRDPNRDHLGLALQRWHGDDQAQFLPVHRLDLGTSGIVLFARNRSAATGVMRQFESRSVQKRYHAVVYRPDGSWSADTSFERRSYLRHRKGTTEEVTSGGKPAESRFRVIEAAGNVALVEATPKTGRTHQLRVHLAALAAPIVGDGRYGVGEHDRLWLHAHRLSLTHPTTDEPLVLHSRRALGIVDGLPADVPNVESV